MEIMVRVYKRLHTRLDHYNTIERGSPNNRRYNVISKMDESKGT